MTKIGFRSIRVIVAGLMLCLITNGCNSSRSSTVQSEDGLANVLVSEIDPLMLEVRCISIACPCHPIISLSKGSYQLCQRMFRDYSSDINHAERQPETIRGIVSDIKERQIFAQAINLLVSLGASDSSVKLKQEYTYPGSDIWVVELHWRNIDSDEVEHLIVEWWAPGEHATELESLLQSIHSQLIASTH